MKTNDLLSVFVQTQDFLAKLECWRQSINPLATEDVKLRKMNGTLVVKVKQQRSRSFIRDTSLTIDKISWVRKLASDFQFCSASDSP